MIDAPLNDSLNQFLRGTFGRGDRFLRDYGDVKDLLRKRVVLGRRTTADFGCFLFDLF